MKRILCVWLPDFPLQRLHRNQPELKAEPCVLYQESGNRADVVMACRRAAEYRIRPGMPLAEAQALLESAVFIATTPEADQRELESLAVFCQRFSPTTGLEYSDASCSLLLDISGCDHLFGDELGLASQLVAAIAEQGWFAQVAVARTIGAAWAIARYGHTTGSNRRLLSLPIEALRLPLNIVTRLREFDLRTIRQLNDLPRESLPSRFGTELTQRVDQLLGHLEELLTPVAPPEPISAQWMTDEPISHPAAVRYVCDDLLSDVLNQVRSRGAGLIRLAIIVTSDTGDETDFAVALTRPSDSISHIDSLLNLKLETQRLPEWISAIHMKASVTTALQVQQQSLFADSQPVNNADLQQLTDRLSTRLGNHRVVRPQKLPEFVPERAIDCQPVTASRQVFVAERTSVVRPLELLPQPEPINVTTGVQNELPIRFHWNHQTYHVAHATRPERISTDWWHEDGLIQRDYYQVETQSGARFWIYQDRFGHWHLHGLFS